MSKIGQFMHGSSILFKQYYTCSGDTAKILIGSTLVQSAAIPESQRLGHFDLTG